MDEDLRMWLLGLDTDPRFDAEVESQVELVSKLFADMVSETCTRPPFYTHTHTLTHACMHGRSWEVV